MKQVLLTMHWRPLGMKSQIWKGVECVRYLASTHTLAHGHPRAKPISPITANRASSRLSVFSMTANYLRVDDSCLTLRMRLLFFNQPERLSFSLSLSLSDLGCDSHGDVRNFSALIVSAYFWLTRRFTRYRLWCQGSALITNPDLNTTRMDSFHLLLHGQKLQWKWMSKYSCV